MRLTRLAGPLLGMVLTAGAIPARAAPMTVTWTTWMRTAPHDDAKVIDELDAGWSVDVRSCKHGWCEVLSNRALGYVPQALLASSAPPAIHPQLGAACMPAIHYTPEQAIKLRVCPAVTSQ